MDSKTEILLPYLDAAWHNSQHHETSRMRLLLLYFIFAGACLLVLIFANDVFADKASIFATTVFVNLFGFAVIRFSVRYKERIMRDIRVIYKIHEILLREEKELQPVHVIFRAYRKLPGKKMLRMRLSTLRYFILTISFISSMLIGLGIHTQFEPVYIWSVAAGAAVFGLHMLFLWYSQMSVAVNI